MEPWADEFTLAPGMTISLPKCGVVQGLPPPSVVADGVGTCTTVQRILSWSPTRTQTGFLQKVCFDATTHVAVRATRCFYMHVGKCRYCAQEGDSLKSLAESYFTDWLQLWAANTDMSNPYQFKRNQLVNIGALYSAKLDETLSALALRFRADVRSLLLANPEVTAKDDKLRQDQLICILPGTCTSADSTYLGGASKGT